MSRIFLLSPANCGGARAKQVLSPHARFALAEALRLPGGAMLGDVFTFVSGLYFRGKLTYALRFAAPPERDGAIAGGGVHVITPNAGLRSPDTYVTHGAVQAFAGGDVHQDNAAYRRPLERSARALAREIGPECDVVLLGSIASPKYVDVLLGIFGDRLRFPIDFVGRGDDPQVLADQMSEAWLAFARTGNPAIPALPDWPAYETGRRATMIFNLESTVADDPMSEVRAILQG